MKIKENLIEFVKTRQFYLFWNMCLVAKWKLSIWKCRKNVDHPLEN